MSKITVTTIAGATSGADANKVKIESGDQLGVGTTPTHPLTVNGQIKSTGSNGETVQLQTSSQYTGVSFIGSDGTRDAIMDYDHTNGVMSLKAHTAGHLINFTTGGYTERFRITDNGVTFNGDTAAANALDDYEEGTWTPTLNFGGNSVGLTLGLTNGIYTKIGNIVSVQFRIELTNKGSSTGAANFGGLPFTTTNLNGNYYPAFYGLHHDVNSNGSSGNPPANVLPIGQMVKNGTTWNYYAADSTTAINNTYFNNNSVFNGAAVYRAD